MVVVMVVSFMVLVAVGQVTSQGGGVEKVK
jgi:hypothetical protein